MEADGEAKQKGKEIGVTLIPRGPNKKGSIHLLEKNCIG